jgi:hypothetical protein
MALLCNFNMSYREQVFPVMLSLSAGETSMAGFVHFVGCPLTFFGPGFRFTYCLRRGIQMARAIPFDFLHELQRCLRSQLAEPGANRA